MFVAGEITRELAGDTRTHPNKISREWKAAVTDACVAVGPLCLPCCGGQTSLEATRNGEKLAICRATEHVLWEVM